MHSYMRAVGFSGCKTKKDVNKIINFALKNPESKKIFDDDETVFALVEKQFSESFGLHIFGEYNHEDKFVLDYYYPYFQGYEITTQDIPTLERHISKESYAGVCDDLKVGVSLIFYLQNIIEYKNSFDLFFRKPMIDGVVLTGLSLSGKILFPISKSERQKQISKEMAYHRMELIAAAREGDEDAIESLTLDDIDAYSMVSRRILKEDLFSIVESYFMPYGVECDQYSVLGEIVDCHQEENNYTKEIIWILTLNCNDLMFDICINEQDILGEPAIGRRFKGNIWLQGEIRYHNE